MNRSSLLRVIGAAVLLAGLAHLGFDWLSDRPEPPEPRPAAKPAPAATTKAARRNDLQPWRPFFWRR
jgi:hypothetical protein